MKVKKNISECGKRLKQARLKRGFNQTELAEKAKVSNQTISKMETGTQYRTTVIVQLATALRINPKWLETGSPPMELAASNVEHYTNSSVVIILNASEVADYVLRKITPQTPNMTMTPIKCSPESFQLVVTDDSMVSTKLGVTSYPKGSILTCDPHVPAVAGDLVIAEMENVSIFRILHEDLGKQYLRPLNSDYAKIELTRVLATVVGVFTPLK